MLSHEDNELMCRVGPETAMGAAMRRYWLPALHLSDLPDPLGAPRPVELLGQNFVVFRDGSGRVGFIDERCCHRGASLLLGHVEDCGIRCIYHGWKFSADGSVLETPNVPDPKFKSRIRARTYPTREAAGLLWVYLGPPEKLPEFPRWPWAEVDAAHRINACAVINCNYVQVLEGLLDSSHLNILHDYGMRAASESKLSFAEKISGMSIDATPRIEVADTDFGFYYAALRRRDGQAQASQSVVARVTAFIAPCFIANPNGDLAFAVVPVNDERANFYHIWWNPTQRIGDEPARSEQLKFVGLDAATLSAYGMTPQTCDSPGRPSRENHFLQDRDAIRAGRHFTGLPGFTQEDAAAAISAGPIRDRTKEMLSISDVAIGRLYRVLLKCARAARQGEDPIGLSAAAILSAVAGVDRVLPEGQAWQSLVPPNRSGRDARIRQ